MPTTSWSDFEPVTQDTDWSDFEPIKETPIIKPTPYQAADIESMTAGRGKAPTGMEAGTEFTRATAGAPALAIPSAIADALIRKSLLAGANIPSALSRVVSPLVGGEEVEPITELPEIKLPRAPGAGAASGLANVGLSTAEGLIQPANWPLLPLMGGGGALGKLAVTGFGAQQAGAIPQETIAAIQTLDDPNATRAEKVGALAKPGVTALLAGAMLRAGQPSPARDVAGMLSEAPMLPRELPEPEPIRAGALATERPVVNPENLISQLGLLEPKPTILPRPEVPRAPSRAFRPEVPATPAEERISAIDEIRQANARTIGEIQKLFPKAQLNREAARLLRDTAWGAKERTENAPEARKEPESNLRKREGVAPGTNLPADQPEVRQGQGEQAGGGNRPEPSKEVPGSEQVPLTPEQQAAEQARLAAELGQEPTPPTTSVEGGKVFSGPLYHGSYKTDLTILNPTKIGDFGSGLYLTTDSSFAQKFADSSSFGLSPEERAQRGIGKVYNVSLKKHPSNPWIADDTPLTKEEKEWWRNTEDGLEDWINTRIELADSKTGRNYGSWERTDLEFNSKDWDEFTKDFNHDALIIGNEVVIKDPSLASISETPPTASVEAPPARDWDLFNENLRDDLDAFSPARATGKVDYDLQDVADRFVAFAKADTSGKPLDKLVTDFAKQDEASAAQIRKLRQSVKSVLAEKPAPPESKAPTPSDVPAEQGETPKSLALQAQREAGWNPEWPFVPADFGNKTFRDAIESDPTISAAEKDQMFSAAEKLLGGKIERTNQPEVYQSIVGEMHQVWVKLPDRPAINVGSIEQNRALGDKANAIAAAERAWKARETKATSEAFSGYHGTPKKVKFTKGEYAGMTGTIEGVIQKRYSKSPDVFRIQVDGFPKPGGWSGKVTAEAGQLADFTPAPPEAKAPTPSDVPEEQSAGPSVDQLLPVTEQSLTADIRQAQHRIDLAREEQKQIAPKGKRTKMNLAQNRRWNELQSTIESTLSSIKLLESQRAGLRATPQAPVAKLSQELQKVARTEGQRSAKEVKSELVARLEKAIEEAPLAADVEEKTATDQGFRKIITQPDTRTKITIDIPGDGVFTIWNTKEALTEVLSRAKKISTSAESKATVPRKAIAQSGQAIRSGEMAKEGVRADKAKELQGKARVAMTDAINQSENEGIIAHQEMDLDPVTDQKRMREWQIRRATPDERTEYWKRNRRELGWVVESRIIKFDEKGNRQVGEWGFSTEGRTRADAIRSTEADVVPPDAVLVDEGLKNWRHIENKTGPFSYIAEGLPPGPGAQTRGEPPYPAISQLTDRLKATPPAGLKDSIPVKERIAEEWARGKSQVTKAVARMRAITESLKDTVRGVRTPTELDRKVAEFDTAIQLSAGRSRQAASAIRRQMRSQTMREAVAIWIDSAGNEKAIQFALDNLPKGIRPSVKRALEASLKLSPEAKSFAEDLKQFYGIRENDAVSHELFEQGLKDYYTHIWEKEQNMPDELRAAFVNGRLSTYFQFSRQRKIPMFLQGILAGKTPVLDPAKVVPFYNYAMDRAIASREFIKQASEVVMPDGRPLLSPSGTRSVIEKGETPEALIIRPKARSEENADYHQVDHPALRKWKWAGTGESGEPILYQGDLLVHPEGFNRLANMMDRGRLTPSKWGGRLLQASTEVKGFKLGMLSLFHNIHVGSHAAFHWTNPFKAIGKEIDWDAPGTKFAIEKGHLKIAPDPSELRIAAEGIMGPGIVHKIPLIGPLSKAWSEWTFGEMIPQLKLATFENAYKRNIWARDNLPLTGLKGLTDEEVAARVGDSVNNAFGELNHMFLGKYGRNPQFQRVLRGIFLAPDFGEARLRFAGKAFTKAGFEERLALATMFTTLYLGARVANFISHGDPEWDWKKAFAVKAGQHWWSMRSVIGDIDRAAADFGRFMYVRLNPLYSRTAADFLFGRDISGRKLTTSQKIGNVFKQLIPIQMGGLTRDDQKLWESFVGAMGLSAQRDRPEQDVSRAVSSWMSKSKDPKIQQKFQQHEGEVFAQSVYAPLRFALEAEDYGKAHDEYEKLLKIRKPSQIRDYMAKDIRTMGGLSVPEFNQFQKQMSPEEKKLLQQAKDNRKVLYQRYLRMTRNGTAINR